MEFRIKLCHINDLGIRCLLIVFKLTLAIDEICKNFKCHLNLNSTLLKENQFRSGIPCH